MLAYVLVCVALWMTLQIILRILRIIMDMAWQTPEGGSRRWETIVSFNVTDNVYTNSAVHLYLTARFIYNYNIL